MYQSKYKERHKVRRNKLCKSVNVNSENYQCSVQLVEERRSEAAIEQVFADILRAGI